MVDSTPAASQPTARASPSTQLAWLALALVLVLGVPQFLRMPLTNDPVYFDLQADHLRQGGMLYRDMVEPNFPGVVWLHALVRPVIGPSSEALRAVDLLFFAASVALLVWGLHRAGRSMPTPLWCAAGMFLFYLSLAEWSHCQRDVWLILPAATGVTLRLRQVSRLREADVSRRSLFGYGCLEGFVWGAAMWLKPYVVIPCVLVWLASALGIRNVRRLAVDGTSVMVGGMVAGALGLWWLIGTGTWPHFWDNLVNWNPEYAAVGRQNWTYPLFLSMCFRFLPWGLLHGLAIPIAAMWCWKAVRARTLSVAVTERIETRDSVASKTIWGAFYLAWMFQALALQILFDYVHVPGVVLATLMVALWIDVAWRGQPVWIGIVAFGALACWASPLPNVERLAIWSQCVFGPSSPELRSQLRQIREPNWVELEQVAEFLESRQLRDGDLICYGNHLVHLYPRLQIRPTNRFVYQAWYLAKMPSRRDAIRQDVADHPPRFIVSDLNSILGRSEFAEQPGADGPHSLPEGIPDKFRTAYPLRYPVVFRAGGLVVLQYERTKKPG